MEINQGVEIRVRVSPANGAACEYPSVAAACRAAHNYCVNRALPPLVEIKMGDGDWTVVRLSNFV